MSERNAHIDAFLTQHLTAPFTRSVLAADASFRRYDRIFCNAKQLVLMDAPPPQEDVRPFCLMTHWLRASGLHAPELLAEDTAHGLLLLEDFGDDSYRKHIAAHPADEWPLYQAALDVLLHLRSASPLPAIAAYDYAAYMRELAVFTDWALPELGKADLKDSFLAIWEELLHAAALDTQTVVLRDYHADNLMWLPQHDDLQRVGLLDYQDALIGDAAYDVVSLLEDARRDVPPDVVSKALAYYLEHSGEDAEHFMARYHLLGAQRNLKIIGIFHRLNRRDGKAHYLDLLPRVWAHLQRDVQHPSLTKLREWLENEIA